ncbi:MAG: sensor of ECF-type sigma factor [Polaribacter sp.]
MKKILFFTTLLFFVSFLAYAQKPIKGIVRAAKIKAIKIAFLTEQLDLTSSEAEKFWPVYNNYSKKLRQLERVEKLKLKVKIKDAGGIDKISEKEATSIMNKISSVDAQVCKTKLAFDKELANVLTYKKLLKLKVAEKDFVRKLMRKYRRKRGSLKKEQ